MIRQGTKTFDEHVKEYSLGKYAVMVLDGERTAKQVVNEFPFLKDHLEYLLEIERIVKTINK